MCEVYDLVFLRVFFYCLRYEFYVFFCFQIWVCLSGGCLELCLSVAVSVFSLFLYTKSR
jgi:hypothetical protein